MESIKFTPECVERTDSVGDGTKASALSHRDRVLEHFASSPGLGPIDLVWCRKEGKGPFSEQQATFFHQVIGHDLTSTASAAAYFADMSRNTEELQVLRTPDAEEAILDSIVDLYYDRVPPRVLNMLRPGGQRGGALPEHNDPMLAAVLQHFQRRRVLEGAVEFFTQVASVHAPAVVHLCVALESLGRTEDALQVLRSNALRMPHDVNIICALASIEAASGNAEDGLMLARHALLLAPKSTTALTCMARVQARCGAPALSVLAMHLIVPPSHASVLVRRVFPFGVPPHERVTQPSAKRWPLEEEEATALEEESRLPRRFENTTNWSRVVKQLCRVVDDGEPEELPYIPPDVHTDTANLRTSIVRLLPYILGVQYNNILLCMREMGMHNFMRVLQALSRSFVDDQVLDRSGSLKENSAPEKVNQKMRLKKHGSSVLRHTPRRSGELPDASYSGTAVLVPSSQTLSSAGVSSSAQSRAEHTADSTEDTAAAPSDGECEANLEKRSSMREGGGKDEAPVEDVDDEVGLDENAAANSVREEPAAQTTPASGGVKSVGTLKADLSHVPADLAGSNRVRVHSDPEGHPVAEGRDEESEESLLASSRIEGVQSSGCLEAGGDATDVVGGEAQSRVLPGQDETISLPLDELRRALLKVDSGNGSVTSEQLGRLQLRAQEHAARVATCNVVRSKQYKKLALGGPRQRTGPRDGAGATTEAHKNAPRVQEDVEPVACKIVDSKKLQSMSEQLMEDAKSRKSARNAEAQKALALLLVATSAFEGFLQEISLNMVHLVTLVLQDLDDAAQVHSAAVHFKDIGVKCLQDAADAVQENVNDFLAFQHHPLGGAALPDAKRAEQALPGDWLAWGGACERLGCLTHARFAYSKAIVLVRPQRCLTANLGIARLIAAHADIHTMFDHLTEILLFMDSRKDFVLGTKDAANGTIREGEVSSTVVSLLATVIDAWGMTAVQNRLEKGSGQYHPSIDPAVEQAFGWGTDGCDA